jgi:hypothetical protein
LEPEVLIGAARALTEDGRVGRGAQRDR